MVIYMSIYLNLLIAVAFFIIFFIGLFGLFTPKKTIYFLTIKEPDNRSYWHKHRVMFFFFSLFSVIMGLLLAFVLYTGITQDVT